MAELPKWLTEGSAIRGESDNTAGNEPPPPSPPPRSGTSEQESQGKGGGKKPPRIYVLLMETRRQLNEYAKVEVASASGI